MPLPDSLGLRKHKAKWIAKLKPNDEDVCSFALVLFNNLQLVAKKLKEDKSKVILFKESIQDYSLPKRFGYPHYYDPHPICLLATSELQHHLINNKNIQHNFGIDPTNTAVAIGKMFGVLVVKDQGENIGYLAAFSGKLTDPNTHEIFVPPVVDIHTENNFFQIGMEDLNVINLRVKEIENNDNYISLSKTLEEDNQSAAHIIIEVKEKQNIARRNRKLEKNNGRINLSDEAFHQLEKKHANESMQDQFFFRELNVYYEDKIQQTAKRFEVFKNELDHLKSKRKKMSFSLQHQIFDEYHFLNANGKSKSLLDLFILENGIHPPAGSGECAAPKLLQYAFLNNLKPIAMAEFWWGKPPSSKIRKHGQFYPACRGKCEPILKHMLQGMNVEDNPLLKNLAKKSIIETVYEDDFIVVINKPFDLLSIPGKSIEDSVQTRMKKKYPFATGPLTVHRLDMSTSGLMLIAKSNEVHKYLQKQFINRTIKKRYIALLDGIVKDNKGVIDLPLRLDIDDRPRQLVCYEHGKPAKTHWKVIERKNNQTLIHFYPVTGRTHQLRVHAAHPLGLNMPIIGDDLYGIKHNRLCLHAERLEFVHPDTRETIDFRADVPF